MASTYFQILPTEEESPHPTSRFRPWGRRTASFSSSSTSNSWDSSFGSFSDEYPPFSPVTTPLNFNGVPFSWEKTPGISKHQVSKMDEAYDNLLPLPPAGNSNSSTKKSHHQEEKHHSSNRFRRDPFLATLVECSKDADHDHDDTSLVHTGKGSSSKISRTLSDGFGCINMYTSCKRTCSISESIVSLPTIKLVHRHVKSGRCSTKFSVAKS